MNRKVTNNNFTFSVIVEKDKDGYVAECRELQGCYTEGKTYEEVLKNIKEVIELHVEDRVERGDLDISASHKNQTSLTTFSLTIPAYA